jgi:hypothetical protein
LLRFDAEIRRPERPEDVCNRCVGARARAVNRCSDAFLLPRVGFQLSNPLTQANYLAAAFRLRTRRLLRGRVYRSPQRGIALQLFSEKPEIVLGV